MRLKALCNQGHLIDKCRMIEYLQEKGERIWETWKASDQKRLREMKELWKQLPREVRRQMGPRVEEFNIPPTRLNLTACPTFGMIEPTEELAEALAYVGRLHKSNDVIEAEDNRIPTAVFGQE
jgi:hypothetical protein